MSYFKHPCRFPKNVDGPFYTLGFSEGAGTEPTAHLERISQCFCCGAPEAEAPTLLALQDDNQRDTYFVRQPTNADEIDQAISAMKVCCVSALRYGGQDRDIIRKLANNPEHCDYIVGDDGNLVPTVGDDGEFLPFARAMIAELVERNRQEHAKRNKKWWQFWL